MPGVKDRVIVITGAGGGLGRTYALLLARAGARVVVNDLGGARDGSGSGTTMADGVVAEIRGAGGEAVASYDSVATEEGAAALVRTAVDAFGTVHGLVSNAGILRDRSFARMTAGEWEAVQHVHLFGAFHVTRAVWPYFRQQEYGRVVMATSTSGLYGSFGQANYGAAKAGLVGLTHTLAVEGAKYNILTNAVAPLASTRMTEDVTPPELQGKLDPAFVAPVVGHLLTEECTDSGTVVVAGGGEVHRTRLYRSRGASFDFVPTIEQVAERWGEITDMEGALPGTNPLG
ncbi:SDR family oxidoreductase [Streptomyces sp. NPDC004609]|uniref:SDR family oxidoreductase n=1 Tax=Streptomyces sp. NPDC004609 TaxID=3364704 RepID=UPI0036A64BC0